MIKHTQTIRRRIATADELSVFDQLVGLAFIGLLSVLTLQHQNVFERKEEITA